MKRTASEGMLSGGTTWGAGVLAGGGGKVGEGGIVGGTSVSVGGGIVSVGGRRVGDAIGIEVGESNGISGVAALIGADVGIAVFAVVPARVGGWVGGEGVVAATIMTGVLVGAAVEPPGLAPSRIKVSPASMVKPKITAIKPIGAAFLTDGLRELPDGGAGLPGNTG